MNPPNTPEWGGVMIRSLIAIVFLIFVFNVLGAFQEAIIAGHKAGGF